VLATFRHQEKEVALRVFRNVVVHCVETREA